VERFKSRSSAAAAWSIGQEEVANTGRRRRSELGTIASARLSCLVEKKRVHKAACLPCRRPPA
jgi:hypothetical protein